MGQSIIAADGSSIASTGNSRRYPAEKVANARLIAAAPDLLAACHAFVEAWEKSLQLEKTDVALRMAKQAIAKAQPNTKS